ncbi:penicillin-binding protein 2 [Thiomonas sp. FB-6]|uniref:penicillin-binding protein 2 n=1 Tax=Thiomonas sp. FB-6 TaxID=1158291 RepID=UPI000373E3C2|nr:penicillin-binding protein 2 [Thiomonas sp. FB-6]
MNSPELKNVGRELLRFRRRLLLAVGGVVLAFGLLIGRWLWLQVLRHRQYSLQARDNRVAIVPVQPSRGLIVDRNGIVLADNFAAYTLEITPSKTVGLAATIAALRAVVPISPHDERRFHALLSQSRSFESVPIRSRLSDAEVARFVAQRFRFPGVEVHARLFRSYPLGSLGCHVIGMVGRISAGEQQQLQDSDQAANYQGADHIGKTGVELGWERQLHGTIGFDEVEVNVAGKPVRKLRSKPPVPGSTLVLSLDARMQKLAEDLYGERSGACVAMDPRSGEVLVMASMPTFDPNLFVEGIDPQNWNQLNTDPRRPLLDRVLRGTFPPGSTYKPYLALGALSLGLRTASYTLNDPGFFMLGHHKFRDDVPGGHGKVDMHKALEVSCDTYFYMVANDWGVDGMHDWTRHFGFGRLTGVDLPGEARGILPSKAWKKHAYKTPALQRWYAGETISLGIGQGYNSFTPIQLANALATMANGGTRHKPRVVRMVEDMATHRFDPTPAEVAERLHLNAADWQVVHDGMVAVNAEKQGTAYAVFKDAPYTSAGKTGTAQVFTVGQHQRYESADLARHLLDHALYTVWAPADNPTICVALIVEHAGWGASAAAPIARKLIDYHLLGKLPSDEEIQKISGRKPVPLPFRYAGVRDGLPPVPGAHAPPQAGASSAAEASSAAAPPVRPWPAVASAAASMPAAPTGPAAPRAAGGYAQARASAALAQEGRYAGAACGGGPLFSRFGAAHECPLPDEGVRL